MTTDAQPTHLDLFSGIGGFALAAQRAGFRTVAFCEIDNYARCVLAKNFLADARYEQSSGWDAPEDRLQHQDGRQSWREPASRGRIHSDIFTFNGSTYRGVDLITGGFPCQPFSVAGKRRGAADDRHIWPEMLRVIAEARPTWVLGENVPGIIPMELDNVLSDLEALGYAARPFVIPACAVDAKHRRDRVWIVCRYVSDAAGNRCRQMVKPILSGTTSQRAIRETQYGGRAGGRAGGWARWEPEPSLGRVANGVPNRVDRLRGLGNAIVPQVACEILKAIRETAFCP